MKTVLFSTALTLIVIFGSGCASSRKRTRAHHPSPPRDSGVVVVEEPAPAPTRAPAPGPVARRAPAQTTHRAPAPARRRAPAPRTRETVEEPWLDVTLTAGEREIIRGYLQEHAYQDKRGKKAAKGKKGLPPGLAKKAARGESLPPGWQKKLVPGQVMPREVYHRCRPLPEEVVVQLPSQPRGTIIVTVEGKVARLARATLEILDVFEVL